MMENTVLNPDLAKKMKLHPYQAAVADFVLRTPRCGLFLPVGAGKTRIILSVLAQLKPKSHILVIAPAAVARLSWAEEITKLGLDIRYKSFVTGPKGGKKLPKKKRLDLYAQVQNDPPTLYTISKELTEDIVAFFGKNWPFHILIVDELQTFKEPSSKRFKALKKAAPYTYRFVGLTGTPVPKGLTDLWGPVWFMDGGARLGKTLGRYREAFFDEGLHINGRCVEWRPKKFMPILGPDLRPVPGPGGCPIWPAIPVDAKTAIHDRIRDIVVSIDISNQIKLPPRIETWHRLPLDPDELTMYKQLAKDQVLKLAGETEEAEDTIIAKNAAALSAKLVQMASGTLYKEDGSFVRIHQKKTERLRYIADNEPTPILVAYWYKSDLEILSKEFPQAVPFSGEPTIKAKWNAGEIPMMLVHPASVGAGLNLQYGGHILVWYTLPWSLECYIQMNGRVYRQGQTHTTVIHYLLAEKTIDERIPKVLSDKALTQQDLIDAVQYAAAGLQP